MNNQSRHQTNNQRFSNRQNNHRTSIKDPQIVLPPGSAPIDTIHLYHNPETKSNTCPKAYSVSDITDIDTYLKKYKNTFISLTLCVCNVEVSGILKDIGHGFLVLEDPDSLNLTIAKISNILTIKMFCNI